MKMTEDEQQRMQRLERLLSEAAGDETHVSSDLAARVLADARALQPKASRPKRRRVTFVDRLGLGFGRWPAFGGLAAAACAGFWIGISPPQGLPDTGLLLEADYSAFDDEAAELSGFGWDLDEG